MIPSRETRRQFHRLTPSKWARFEVLEQNDKSYQGKESGANIREAKWGESWVRVEEIARASETLEHSLFYRFYPRFAVENSTGWARRSR